jgi:hypothetical protein
VVTALMTVLTSEMALMMERAVVRANDGRRKPPPHLPRSATVDANNVAELA